jgi:hypothetical protein
MLPASIFCTSRWLNRSGRVGNSEIKLNSWKESHRTERSNPNAWQLNPEDSRIADKMLEVELGQGEGRDRLELWFDRAMALNTNDYKACSTKLNYLMPKWYGSTKDMLQFGPECATNMQ